MIGLLAFSPTIFGLALMGGSVALGSPISFDRVSWLFIEAQAVSVALAALAIVAKGRKAEPIPTWRRLTNLWAGRVMAALAIFYVLAFALLALRGN